MREITRSNTGIGAAARRAFAAAALILSTASLALLALPATTASAAPPPVVNPSTAGAIYDNIPSPLPGNLVSESFEAQTASEFGGAVTFAGTPTTNALVTVIMSSWGCQTGHWTSDNCETTPGSTFSEPITLNIYNPGPATTEGSAPGSLVASVTQTFNIPFRPSKDDTHCTGADLGKWYDAASATCFNGFATPIQFNLAGKGITLPSSAVLSLAYNTSDYGANPYGDGNPCNATDAGCGYDSLNVATTGPPTVGSDPLPNDAYLNSSWTGAYCDPANPGVGTFVLDTGCWTGEQPAIEVQTPVATVLHANPSIAQIIPGLSIYLKLSAQLTTTAGNPLAFEHVTFTVGGGLVCVGITDASGTASCALGAGVLQSVLDLGYQASFAGDGVLQPTSAHGPILVVLGVPLN